MQVLSSWHRPGTTICVVISAVPSSCLILYNHIIIARMSQLQMFESEPHDQSCDVRVLQHTVSTSLNLMRLGSA